MLSIYRSLALDNYGHLILNIFTVYMFRQSDTVYA